MLEIFQYGFIRHAFMAGLIIGLICPLIGLFIVLKRLSMIGDALSHVSLAGIAAGMILGIYPVYGALILMLLAGLIIERLRTTYQQYAELAIAVVLSSGMSLAVILLSAGRSFNTSLFTYLFGSILTVSKHDLFTIGILGVIIVATVVFLRKELFFVTFEEEAARLAGVPVTLINLILILLTACTIAASIRIVGMLLTSSLMVIPVATSLQLKRGFYHTLILAVLFSLLAVIGGLILAIYLNLAPGGTIVFFSVLILLFTLLSQVIQVKLLGRPQ